ncbi:MAG TPA: hypothetical protein VN684_03150 [Terriglobales bacterium]|nr:hypothetical protein [Terriglobales bacterium]
MKVGDKVVLIGIPSNLKDDEELQTRALFEKCIGKIFPIKALESVEGLSCKLVRLDVGEILGKEAFMETIWVEPEFLRKADF